MEKSDFIQNLKQIKIVVGNGFDLHCGLKSSYGDFFDYFKTKFDNIKSWIDKYSNNFFNNYLVGASLSDCWVDFEDFDKNSVWDLFFEIITDNSSLQDEARWCDIENEILASLIVPHIDKTKVKNQPVCWRDVYKIINGEKEIESSTFCLVALSAFTFRKNNSLLFESEEGFYEFLLDELRKFEISFGKYLKRQHDYFDRFINHHNTDYDVKAAETISRFGMAGNVISIDSFNFGSFNNRELDSILRNINGTLDMPIFGIDSNIFKSDDLRFIFSKTNRRMEIDMIINNAFVEHDFKNAVVYGHSLNKSDYSYFFPLLDKLEMTDFSSQDKIVFAFSIYDKSRSHLIKSSHRKAVQELFEAYSCFKGFEKEPGRLLDSLTIQGRIVFYEIPSFDTEPSYFWN